MRIPDYFVRVVELPAAVRGVTVPNDDGTFSVYINALYDDETQRRTLEHELAHLARDHFYSASPIAVQEAEASGPRRGRRRCGRKRSGSTPVGGRSRTICAPSARWINPSKSWVNHCGKGGHRPAAG